MSELTSLICDLVRIDSVNPALDPSHPGEGEIASYVAAWAGARDLKVQRLEPVKGRPSVIVTSTGIGSGPTLMLNAHLDTVGVTGMSAPFEPRTRDGRMYGRGVMDMKASLAVCLMAVASANRRSLGGHVVLTAVADEEHGSIGTEAVLREVQADAAIVTEPTDLELQVAHRGFSVFEVEFEGKASHTSRPEEGVNAVTHMGRLLDRVERFDFELRRREPHPLLAHGSLQGVLASGGHELFTTPASATLTVERRTLPGETAAGARAELDSLLAELRHDDPTVRVEARSLVEREPFEMKDGSGIGAALAGAIREVRGQEPLRLGAPYWTDAALVAAAGVPTVLFGPIGGDIHQPTEWLDVESAVVMLRVLESAIEKYCG